MTSKSPDIEALLKEDRLFRPNPELASRAHIGSFADYERLYARSMEDPEKFWGEMARELDWFEPFSQVLDWQPPFARWFLGGTTNLAYNCLDRHVRTWRRNKVA